MRLSLNTGQGTESIDAAEVAWVLPASEADLMPIEGGGFVGMARGMPVVLATGLEGARWLVLLQPNGDLYPARLALEIDWN